MKKLIGISLLALSLTACASIPSTGDLTTRAKQIQEYTRLACSFVPTIQTIAAIINKGAGDALSVASDICNAVTTAPLAEGGRRVIVARGVRVKGKFVR